MTHCAQYANFPVRLVCACTLLLTVSRVGAEDFVERTSVIPITKKSVEQVGIPIQVRTVNSGSSSRRVKRDALSKFPSHLMTQQSQAAAQEIFDNLSIYRRLPTIEFEADRRCYEYFTNHPDVAVSIWRAMKISKVELTKESETKYETDTRDGTKGVVQVLLNSPEHYIVTCQGEFKSPAIKKPIQAIAMMHLQPHFTETGGVTHQLDMYVSFPSNAIEAIARLISPVSNRIADRNFEEISLFVKMMSLAMSKQPGWIEQLTREMDGIRPEDTEALLKLTASIYVDAVKAERAFSGKEIDVHKLLPPTQTAMIPE